MSVDSRYCHANWAADLGGICYPLLADFHPKGAVAKSYGVYLENAGITDRATVLIDSQGVVRYTDSVTPAGKRDIAALLESTKAAVAAGGLTKKPVRRERPTLAEDATLFVKDGCGFCRSTMRAVTNLHLGPQLKVRNVTQDPSARAELDKLAGQTGAKVPALVQHGKVQFESGDIIKTLSACFELR